MKLAHIIGSQAILLGILYTVLYAPFSAVFHMLMTFPLRSTSLRVSDEKTLILLYLSLNVLFCFVLEWISSQVSLVGSKSYYRRTRRAYRSLILNTFTVFFTFLLAYIYKILHSRVFNLLCLSTLFSLLTALGHLLYLDLVSSTGHLGFITTTIVLFSHIFIPAFEGHFETASRFVRVGLRR